MAALSVSCIQQHEVEVGKYLKSIKFLEQTYQNSLENGAETLLGLISLYAVCRPLAVEADTLSMPPLAHDTRAVCLHILSQAASTCPQHCPERGEITARGAATEFCSQAIWRTEQ